MDIKVVENLTIEDFALCPSHLFLLISIFALTDFGNSRQSSLVPFAIARFYCIVSNAFKPFLRGPEDWCQTKMLHTALLSLIMNM